LINLVRPRSVIEIGSWKGVSTEAFLLTVPLVLAVDPWDYPDGIFEEFMERCGAYPGLGVRRGKSPEALEGFNNRFEMCYIDAEHTYDAVRADILAASKIVKDDGWIAGHDFQMPQVEKAVLSRVKAPILFRDGSWLVKNRIME
jgi:predicted O-methyltransferase YrrM